MASENLGGSILPEGRVTIPNREAQAEALVQESRERSYSM